MRRFTYHSLLLVSCVWLPIAAAAEPAFLRSVSELEDPRGYCIDVPGFGASLALDGPIATHSCKYGRPGFYVDELLEQTEEGRLRLVTYDRCLAASSLTVGAAVHAVDCGTAHAWRLESSGRLVPAAAANLCLTLAAERRYVNTDVMTAPPYSSRAIALEPCAEDAAFRQRWRWSDPHEMQTWNANTLRRRMPAHIAERIRALGPVIDPPATAAIYAGEPRMFGPADVEVAREIRYGPHARHLLDVYTGKNRRSPVPVPVLVLVHGGGFTAGSLASLADAATHFAGLGFVVVNITYPLAPESKFPAGPQAVGAAIKWTRDNASRYGGDPERIFVLGASAGATHVAGYVFMPGILPPGTPEVAGAILYSPNFVVDWNDPGAAALYYGNDRQAVERMLVPDNIERTSIPVLTTVAEFDPMPFQQSAAHLYHVLLNRHGVKMRLRQLPGHNHLSVQFSIGTQDTMFVEEVLDFIATTMPRSAAGSETTARN